MPSSPRSSASFEPFEQAMRDLSLRLVSRDPLVESVMSRLLQHTALRLTEHLDAPLRAHGLNTTLWTALLVIYSSAEHRLMPSALSVFMNSSRTNITRVARDLAAHGFVKRLAGEQDRRQVFLQLTRKGLDFVQANLPRRREQLRHLFSEFSEQELGQFDALVRKLLRAIE